MNVQKSKDLRFLKKILTDIEIKQVRASADPDTTLWSFWACKEAAYKVIKKQTGDAAFVPRRWFVSYWQTADHVKSYPHKGACNHNDHPFIAGAVTFPDAKEIPFRLYLTSSHIHCVAADGLTALDQTIWQVDTLPLMPDGTENDPSVFVRLRLADRLAILFRQPLEAIEIHRPNQGGELLPPTVHLYGKQLTVDISLSHDGHFVAYAFHLP